MKFKWKYFNLFIFDDEVIFVIPFYKYLPFLVAVRSESCISFVPNL